MQIGSYRRGEALLAAAQQDRQARIDVYVPSQVEVILGRGSKPAEELHLSACATDGVPVLRRRGGGCAVVLDPGNVVVLAAEHAPGIGQNKAHFARLSAWLVSSLARLGVTGLTQRGISDLALGERKVAGASLHRSRDSLLYSVSLLVNPRISLMARYLKHPPREPDYRRGRSHKAFVGALSPDFWQGNAESLARRLEAALKESQGRRSP